MPNFSSSQVTVTTTAALVLTADTDGCRVIFHVDTNGSHIVYLGAEGLTTSTGFSLHPGDNIQVALAPNSKVYAVTGTGTESLQMLIVGN
jgi:hypothetical protein